MQILRAREILNDSRLLLIVVESVELQHNKTNTNCQLYGDIKPIALIVCALDKTYALDMESNPTSIDRLREGIPELNAIITSFNAALNSTSLKEVKEPE